MAKQTINTGTSVNKGDGDPLRIAFSKINNNFTELYAAIGLDENGLNLANFEFTSSTITTTDSSDITIAQNVNITSELTMSGDIIPAADNLYDLGAPDKQFRSIYVSGDTIHIAGNTLSIDQTGNLTFNNNAIATENGEFLTLDNLTDVNASTPSIGDVLAWNGGNWVNAAPTEGSSTGDITFAGSTVSAGNEDEIIIQAKDTNSFATARLSLEPVYSSAQLSAYSAETVETFTLANGDFATGVWQNNGFGNGVVAFTGAQNIGDFFQNTLSNLTAANVSITINSEPAILWNGGFSGSGTDAPGFGTNPTVPASPITITSIVFRYRSESFISVNYDNQEIRLNAQNAGIRMDSDNTFQVFGDSRIELQSAEGMSLSAGEDIDISTNSSFATRISTGDFTVNAFDDIRIEGRDSFRLINSSASAPIRIITNDDATPRTWAFNPDGSVTFPDATVQTTAFTGVADIAQNIESENDVSIRVNLSDSTTRIWRFGEDGNLTLPGGGNINGSDYDIDIIAGDNGDNIYGTVSLVTNSFVGPGTNSLTFNSLGEITVSTVGANDGLVKWVGNSSGDGNGYTTMVLVPDTTVEGNDQYLIIDPTAPSHIHIRAGGTQDASNAELYLGGEKNNVRINDGVGVRLYNEVRDDAFSSFSDPADFNTATWYGTPGNYFVQFTEVTAGMGNLAFAFSNDAENRVTVSYGVGETSVLTYGGSTSNLGGGVYRFAVVEAPATSPTVLTAIEFQIWTTNNNRVELQNNDFTVSVKDDVRITGNDLFSLRNTSPTEPITIRTDYDGADRGWEFAADGTLSTPGDIVVNGDVTGTAGGSTLVLRAEPGSNTAIQLNDSVDSEIRTVADFEIRTDVTNTPRVWTFGTNGGLTFPDTTVQTTAWTGVADIARNIESENDVSVRVNLTDSTTHTWRFGEDGHLNLPSGGGNIQSDGTIQLITGSSTFTVTDDVFGFLNTKNGTVALSLVSGGISITGSGNFAFSGNAFAATTANNINFTSGSGITLNSPVTEVRGNNLTLVGNAVDIQSEGNINIDINLSDSTLRRWRFGEDGDLTFPDTSVQTTAFTGNAATVDILNTNGIDTNYSITFVENRDGAEILRADVDLTFNSWSNTLTAGNVTTGVLKIEDGVHEQFQTKADATGVVTHDCSLGHIIYHTSPDDYFTVNLTNLNLASGYATSITVVVEQGATGYGPNALQIGGAAQTINWQGGSLPASPTANGVDVCVFSILNNNGTYVVLAQVTGFNEVA